MWTAGDAGIDPATASSPQQYVELLRRVREQSGLSYREIARCAKRAGASLPASTLATMLARPTLPRKSVVAALLRACAVPGERIDQWLATWNRLATAPDGDPATEAPPARPPTPFQLPPAPTVLIGRETQVDQLLTATTRGGVCLIEGVAGVGKTALALAVAHRIAGAYAGGCLYADLQGASAGLAPLPPWQVLACFVRALGTEAVPPSVAEASALFRSMVAERGVLVLLDNAANLAQVAALLPGAASCMALVTSRWNLAGLDATTRVELPPLPYDAALALLSRLCGPDQVSRHPVAASVIVRRCGGLPLALRIVGARAATRAGAGLTRLAERIDDERRRLDVLEVGDLSVRASLSLGYQALRGPGTDRRLAARLFRLASLPDWVDTAACAVAALAAVPAPLAERALDDLLDARLLEPAGADRYRFHDVVRLVAREQAAADEHPAEQRAAMRRLTGYLAAAAATATRLLCPHERLPAGNPAPPADGPADALRCAADAWAWFEQEHTNLLMIARQQLAAGEALHEVRDLALFVVRFIDYAGYVTEQAMFGQVAVEAADRIGDPAGAALALNILAVAMLRDGRADEGIALLERNLAVQRRLGNRPSEAACLNNLGVAHRDKGDFDTAVEQLRASLAIRRELHDWHKEGTVLDNLAVLYRQRGLYPVAIAHHQASLAIIRQGSDQLREALVLVNLAETLHRAGDRPAAATYARQALDICQHFDHQHGIDLAQRVLRGYAP